MHAAAVKDQMLWTAMQDKARAEEALESEKILSNEYATEVTKWAEISQGMGQQIALLKQEKEAAERRNRDLIETLRKHNIYYN
jgi:hypothetical protein